jgi:hypothetical protein
MTNKESIRPLTVHLCIGDTTLAGRVGEAVKPHAAVQICPQPELAVGAPSDDALVIADSNALLKAEQVLQSVRVIALSTGSVNDDLELLARHPWVSQLVTPDVLEGSYIARILNGIPRVDPQLPVDTTAFLGAPHLNVRRVLFYRSSDIDKRLDRVGQFAESMGGGRSVIDRLYEIGHELLANAFWDAPYEAGFTGAPSARESEVKLPPDRPVELMYGALDKELFLRVRDCYGALSRSRLYEVLLRCARNAASVPLDESRGGAGLGLWRVFRNSSRVIISVVPAASTEFLVSVPLLRSAKASVRAWHLLFPPAVYRAEASMSR